MQKLESAGMNARELEALLIKQYGPDFRDKVIVSPIVSFRLANSFEECGLQDPSRPEPTNSYGLWQFSTR